MSLKVNDPVEIENKLSTISQKPLQGVVAFIGPVSFSEGDDWVGIRLTGAESIGQGKNDGSVKGVRYFTCPANCGTFVKSSSVKKRSLSKLEELRLKRELKSGNVSGSRPSSSGGSLRSSRPRSSADDDSSVASMSSIRTSGTMASSRSRLDEIRSRRMLLKSGGTGTDAASPAGAYVTTTPKAGIRRSNLEDGCIPTTIGSPTMASPTLQESPPKVDPKVSQLKQKLETLSNTIQTKEKENASLIKSLEIAQERADNLSREVEDAKATLEENDKNKMLGENLSTESTNNLNQQLSDAKNKLEELTSSYETILEEKNSLNEQLNQTMIRMSNLQEEWEKDSETKYSELQLMQNEVSRSRSKISTIEKELEQRKEQTSVRDEINAAQYKERAKLQVEISSWKRKVKEMESGRTELEVALEEVTLDKEQIQEQLEAMMDKIEEFKIDLESAQIESDELRMELEEAKEHAENLEATACIKEAGSDKGTSNDNDNDTADSQDVTHALGVQNARLREAIVRLREQTAFDKMEMSKALRKAEKDSDIASSLHDELKKLKSNESKLETEVEELKEMVDEGSAFEQMVEDMSDRIMALEDNNISLQSMIRELEEAGELNAEMEEAQADEIKALTKDLQNRDTIILNLEEAIKTQRLRELDFQVTVGNYRMSVEKLQQEKKSLLSIQEGDKGMRTQALVSSQKALAQAAQLVSDTVKAREREAEASIHLVDAQVMGHLSRRLETFLPQSVASNEITSVKAELMLAKVSMKASLAVSGVLDIFTTNIQKAKGMIESDSKFSDDTIPLTDALSQNVANMIHQVKFSQLALQISSYCIKILTIGQWPSLLSVDASYTLGNAIIHAVPGLDLAISEQLHILKKEGGLSPHRSNLTGLDQAFKTASLEVSSTFDDRGDNILPDFSPPCWEALKLVSAAKFYTFGAASTLASIFVVNDSNEVLQPSSSGIMGSSVVCDVLITINKICSETVNLYGQLSGLNILDASVANEFNKIAYEWEESSKELFVTIEGLFSGEMIVLSEFSECESSVKRSSSCFAKLTSLLRSSKIISRGPGQYHALSPETLDPWGGIENLTQEVSEVDYDGDVNYMIRARTLEGQLSSAVENDTKLTIYEAKVISLEKLLTTRSKEISIQNSRLAELESLLSQSSRTESTELPKLSAPSEETKSLKEEVRVLTEAVDVLQTQVDEYEREIRSLKELDRTKTPGKRRTPGRKGVSFDTDFSLSKLGAATPQRLPQDTLMKSISLESAFFRPSLRAARVEISTWKSKAIKDQLFKLPPLSVTTPLLTDMSNIFESVIRAEAELRKAKASVQIVDISKANARVLLHNERSRLVSPTNRLNESSLNLRNFLSQKAILSIS